MNTKELSNGLLGLNVVGTVAWLSELSSLFGCLAALVGALAGIMLVCIRWQEFAASVPAQWAVAKWRKLFPRAA